MELLKKGWSVGVCSIAVLAVLFINLFNSCREVDCPECHDGGVQKSRLTIHLLSEESETKSTESQTLERDNAINRLDVFVFDNSSPSSAAYQKLDTYKRFEGGDLADIELTTTTGRKTICIIANSHQAAYPSIVDMESFRSLVTRLVNEQFGDFTMYGETDVEVGLNTTVSVLLQRFVSKVVVTSVKTAFSGPYTDMSMTECKLYLINVHGDKFVYDGSRTSVPVVLNEGALVSEDVNGTMEAGLIMDSISEPIGKSGHTVTHYLYCYANETDDISKSTKLVLQANIDGVTYYYPIPVNQVGYGYSQANKHYGISRNTVYSFGITVTRPGSIEPNEPVVPGTVIINSLDVKNWNIMPEFNKIF